MKNIYRYILTISVLLFAWTTSAKEIPPVLFSFASDDHHNGPTFSASTDGLLNGKARVELIVDLNEDAEGGSVTFLSNFDFVGRLYDYKVVQLGSGSNVQYLHTWKVRGTYTFTHINVPSNPVIHSAQFSNALLTSYSPFKYNAGETFTLQDSESVDQGLLFYTSTVLQGLGVEDYRMNYFEDFAFTLTHVQGSNYSTHPALDEDGRGYFLERWISEGSFSSATGFDFQI